MTGCKGSPFKKSPLALPVGEGWDGIITMMSCDTDNCYDEDMMTMLVVYGCDAIFTIVLLREHQVYKNLRESSADHVMTIDTSCIVMMMKITSMIMMTMTMMMTWKRWCKVRSKECFSSAAKHFTLNLQFAAFRS